MTEQRRRLIAEAIGFVSACLTTVAFVPGVKKVWELSPAPASQISKSMYVMLFAGTLGWGIYGLLKRSPSVIIANAVSFLLVGSVLVYKLLYG